MNKKRYWLRGLLVGLAAWTLMAVFLVFHCGDSCSSSSSVSTMSYILDPISLFLAPDQIPFQIALGTLPFMLVGAIIGWFYGKMKSGNS
jgi:hypothetical protein